MLRFIREWRERTRILREDQQRRDPNKFRLQQIVHALMQSSMHALEGGDRITAQQTWNEAQSKYPDLVMESRGSLYVLIGLRRFDEAEMLMQEGCKRYPSNSFFWEGSAIVATRRGNNEDAAHRYAILRKRFPRIAKGYTDATVPLIKLGRLEEADRILGRLAHNTVDTSLAIEYAKLAMLRKDWPVALQRWKAILHPTAPLGIAQCHREMGRFDDAEEILTDELKRPRLDSLTCFVELARIAESRENWTEAARRWDDVRKRAPTMLDAYSHAAIAFEKCGQESEMESVLYAAIQRFPSEPQPWVDYAVAAERSGNANEAATRWEEVRVRFPDRAINV